MSCLAQRRAVFIERGVDLPYNLAAKPRIQNSHEIATKLQNDGAPHTGENSIKAVQSPLECET